MPSRSATAAHPEAAAVATRAVLRAAELLGVRQNVLARVLGADAATISRYRGGTRQLKPATKSWEAALLFIRLFRALDAMTGSDDEASRSWLAAENAHLRGVPLDLICTLSGLVHVVDYLDAFRAKV